ncbi:MAG: PAS domain-containing sensor histidine kinase [Myxococcales bacterium]|nr:PAS domain-containing sensor histidine kinase [Myxococcales bacterium]
MSQGDESTHDSAESTRTRLAELERVIAERDAFARRCLALEKSSQDSRDELRRNQRLLHHIAEHAPAVLYVKDLDGRFLLSNRRHARLLGQAEDAIVGKRELDLVSSEEAAAIDALSREVIRSGEPAQQELCFELADGEHWFLEDVFPLYDDAGSIFALGGVATDVTQRKRIEQQLSRTIDDLMRTQRQLVNAEKMAALGGLVAGVAHEINTPVGIGVTAASHLRDQAARISRAYEDGALTRSGMEEFLDVARQSSQMILANLQRASELVQSFKLVAVDQSSEERRAFHVRRYLEEIIRSLQPKLRQSRVEVALSGGDFITVNYPGALSQVITNLVINSLTHAYDEGARGRITISARARGDVIELEFADDGRGIDPANQERVFEPFFTTRRGRGGSGLGLHVLYNLVTQRMGGTVRCRSDGASGTSFHIELPRAPATSLEDAQETGV